MAESDNNSPAAVLDLLLDKGIILPPSTNICCPPCNPYVLASVETMIKYLEAVTELNCCYNIAASVETYLKWAESAESEGATVCSDDSSFSNCLTEIQSLLSSSEYATFLDKGIVETGHIGTDGSGESWLCILATYLQSSFNLQTGTPVSTISEMLDRIQDKGIVIECIPEGFIIASIETYLKWAEAVG